MTRDALVESYFDWLINLVCEKRYSKQVSYEKLLRYLHKVEFTYVIQKDENRAMDGIDLRWRFAHNEMGYQRIPVCLGGPCSIFEMMVALALRCEEDYMDDPTVGNRTGQWFWNMIVSLGLGSMTDDLFDKREVDDILDRFLNRYYSPNGRGGLFTVKNCPYDIRELEIWDQMCLYLDTIT